MAITNIILETNQHAKQQIALESQRAENDIKAAVADDDCAVRVVPAGAVKRMHEYAKVYVPVPVGPLPASLTAETPQPDLPDPFTWGASLNLNVALLSALAQCNRDKADIRTFENNRAGQTDGTIKR